MLSFVHVIAGCAGFQPSQPAPDTALPQAHSALWRELDAVRSDGWHRVLNGGEDALDWRLRLIDSASSSIDLETFLWKPDASGARMLQHLLAAADRGVRVRILLDDSFTMHEDLALHAIDEHARIEYRIYNPFARRHDNVVLRQLLNLGEFGRVNRRLHNKTLIVDGRAAITGGRNIADEYFGLDPAFNFRDMDLLFAGAPVADATRHFDRFWNSRWAVPVEEFIAAPRDGKDLGAMRAWLDAGTDTVPAEPPAARRMAWLAAAREGIAGEARFVADAPAPDAGSPAAAGNAALLAQQLLALLDDAREDVVLVSAYLVPTPELESAIARATGRGVRVRILTNSLRSNNHLAADSAYRRHLHALLGSGVELHEMHALALDRDRYMRTPVEGKRIGLHAKLMLVDRDISYVGSCNLDPRSLRLNTETGLVVRGAALNGALRELLAADFDARNAWAVSVAPDGAPQWRAQGEVRGAPPADSPVQRLEDWFLGVLPIESQL